MTQSSKKKGTSTFGSISWIQHRFRVLTVTTCALPIITWLAVVAWRPWVVGFYHDDWSIIRPLLPGDALQLFENNSSRPIYALLLFSVRLLLPADPFYYQALLALLTACSAFAIGLLAQRLIIYFAIGSETSAWAVAISASVWLALPWNLGISVWPTTFPAQISIILFCILGIFMLGNDTTKIKLAKAIPVFLALSLISELFWFSFIPLIWMTLCRGFREQQNQKEPILLLLGFSSIQVLLVAFNRMLVFWGHGINRTINPSFPEVTLLSLRLLPSEFTRAVVMPTFFWSIASIIMLGMAGCVVFHPKKRALVNALLAIGLGCLISLVLFALAGYRVESIGIFSRTTAVISVWLSLIPAVAIATSRNFGSWFKWLINGCSILLLVLLASSSIVNVQAWRKSWEFQKAVLKSLPIDDLIRTAENDSFILIDANKPEDSVEGFEGFWDISGALLTQYPSLKDRFAQTRGRHFASMLDHNKKQTTWDGKEIVQSWCHTPTVALWKLAAPSQVFLWNYSAKEFSSLRKPAQLGCEQTK